MSKSTDLLKSALGLQAAYADAHPKRLLAEQRAQALRHLAKNIFEGSQDVVLQLLDRDPSLAWESVAEPGTTSPMPVPLACLQCDMLAAVLSTLSKGYDIDAPSSYAPSYGGLITHAITRSKHDAAMLLIGLGASVSPLPGVHTLRGDDAEAAFSPLASAISNWLIADSAQKGVSPPRLPYAILDAIGGVAPDQGAEMILALVTSASAARWDEPDFRKHATSLMGRLVKAGARLSGPRGDAHTDPITAALGRRNGHAIVSLIAVGAPVDSGTGDILDRMRNNSLQDFVPQVQSLLMERTIDRAVAKAKAENAANSGVASAHAGDPGTVPAPRAPTSRRVGAGI